MRDGFDGGEAEVRREVKGKAMTESSQSEVRLTDPPGSLCWQG
jgi:hypothetical protein